MAGRGSWLEINSQNLTNVNLMHCYELDYLSQLTFTYSKSTIETVEKGVKYVQS